MAIIILLDPRKRPPYRQGNTVDLNFNGNAEIHFHGCVADETRVLLEKIMTAIKDFADKMATHNNKVDQAVDGLKGDIRSLGEQIAALQNSQGVISAEDQALLDGIEAKQKSLADKVGALDELTPPIVPTTP